VKLVLASESARRIALLRQVGYEFEARRSGFPEVTLDEPRRTVEANARGKALAIAAEEPGTIVLGADTIVYLPVEAAILGQAADAPDVERMLRMLCGRVHEVYSGVAVAHGDEMTVETVVTQVRIQDLPDAGIDAYVRTGEGVGKAGGYAIQGRAALFVEWIRGDYSNVVGLPLNVTYRMLEAFGVCWW
jgi:septum formation protein